jgi:hypothetical protein
LPARPTTATVAFGKGAGRDRFSDPFFSSFSGGGDPAVLSWRCVFWQLKPWV